MISVVVGLVVVVVCAGVVCVGSTGLEEATGANVTVPLVDCAAIMVLLEVSGVLPGSLLIAVEVIGIAVCDGVMVVIDFAIICVGDAAVVEELVGENVDICVVNGRVVRIVLVLG